MNAEVYIEDLGPSSKDINNSLRRPHGGSERPSASQLGLPIRDAHAEVHT